MGKKIIILIIVNLFFYFCYKITYSSTNIKDNHDKWKQFYDEYKYSPFSYIENFLPFSIETIFLKISNFEQKLSNFIKNIGYTDYDEEDSESDPLFKNETNITNSVLPSSDSNYDNYFGHAIDEINILSESVEYGYKLNLQSILREGLNKHKMIILLIFFVQQLHIFQSLKQKIDLNRIYLQGKNKTNIEGLEVTYEILFDYENIHEMFSLTNQFIDYHKDFGFFAYDELKKKEIPKISKSDKKMINLIINLRNKKIEDYYKLNEFEVEYFLNVFAKTVRCVNYLLMANSMYKKGLILYTRDTNILKVGFIAFSIIVNMIILLHYEDDIKVNKRKKYKYN